MADTDQEIFDSSLTEDAPQEATEAPTEAKEDRARDDRGKFVEAAQEAPEAAEEAPQPESRAGIPSWRLAEEAERRRQAESALNDMRQEMRNMQLQMANFRPPQQQQAPQQLDPFADPEGFARNIQGGFEQRLQAIQLENSLRFARYAHSEQFDAAYEAFVDHAHRTRDAVTYRRVMDSPDVGEALVSWYRDQELQRELGGSDLKTFMDKQREEWLKDPQVQAKVIEAFKESQSKQPSNNLTNLPPTLSRAAGAKGGQFEDQGGSDDQSMYSFATKS